MSEFSFPPNTANTSKKKTNLYSLLLSDFSLFCYFIVSHPLYFCYFIIFSPYVIKILSFLPPVFITTSLLLLALFTTFFLDDTSCTQPSEKSKPCFLLSAYQTAVEKLRSNADDANGQSLNFVDLEAYRFIFDTSNIVDIIDDEVSEENESSASESPVDKHMCHESLADQSSQLFPEVKNLGGFLKETDCDDFVSVSCEKGENESNEVEEQKIELVTSSGSKAMLKVRVDSLSLGGGGDDHLDEGSYNSPSYGSSIGCFGSMRKEKEWRRTLACKLFEERHNNNGEGSEGMDMLWETYEADSNKQHLLAKSKTKKGKKFSKFELLDDDDDDDEEIDNGQLCCLQALKLSAGKMNLGMGRPNLVKISKAFKGIGWLHKVTKHGKKNYH